mgnify:CR=1 FL=1
MKTLLLFLTVFAFFLTPTETAFAESPNRERSFDAQHYVIRLSFDQNRKKVFGNSTIRLKPLSDNFKLVELDANRRIKFRSITLENSNSKLKYKHVKDKLFINLHRAYKRSDTISLHLKYETKPKKGIRFVDARRENGKVIRSRQIWTQGETEETHHWLPSFDFPSDKATTEQFITVKNGETVIANGELIGKTRGSENTVTFHYRMSVPQSLYLTSFVVGKYLKVSDTYKNIPLGYYVYPGQITLVPKAYGKTKDMFRIFEQLTGVDYPFNKYDQTVVANFNIGGMENITATTMSDSEIALARFDTARSTVEDLVAHELAHSWFGNLVTCKNWAELWLNEGFATFMEAAYREQMYGRKDYIRKIHDDAATYFSYASARSFVQHGLFNLKADPKDDDTMFDPISYQKGSAVIHTLREEVGEGAFWRGINLYLKRHKFANVESNDLQKAFEETSGKDLKWFFDQWVKAEGYPQIEVRQVYSAKTKTLTLEFRQNHQSNANTPRAFRLPMNIEIRSFSYKEITPIVIDQRVQTFSFKLDEKPDRVSVDSSYKISSN